MVATVHLDRSPLQQAAAAAAETHKMA